MDSEAFNFYNQAEKKLKGGGGCFAMCGSKNEKFEEAIDLFERAAQLFVRAKQWAEAGQCYEQICDCQRKIGQDTVRSLEQASYYFSQVAGSKSKIVKMNKNYRGEGIYRKSTCRIRKERIFHRSRKIKEKNRRRT